MDIFLKLKTIDCITIEVIYGRNNLLLIKFINLLRLMPFYKLKYSTVDCWFKN